MNQILVVENKRGASRSSSVNIKKIILFFSIAIIIFGIVLVANGVLGLNKNKQGNEQNPSGIIVPTPTPDDIIDTDDEEAPTIELSVVGENVKIIARDETAIDYIEYRWNDEESQIANADIDDKNKIEATIELKQGNNILKVIAVDKAGNEKEKQQEFIGKIRPVVELFINVEGDGVIIKASCEDGISKIEYTLNGEIYRLSFEDVNYAKEDWESIGVLVNYSDDGKIISMEYTQDLVEGENRISAYAYSLSGLVGGKDGTCTYTPPATPTPQ